MKQVETNTCSSKRIKHIIITCTIISSRKFTTILKLSRTLKLFSHLELVLCYFPQNRNLLRSSREEESTILGFMLITCQKQDQMLTLF